VAIKKKYYVNNKDFYAAIVKHREAVKKHTEEKRNSEPPRIPDYVGECFMKIAERLASRPNFSGYSFRAEMVGDGIENCIIGYHSFDPDRFSNPFAYFTQIVWFAFLRRIEKEKKQSYIKHMSLVNMSIEMSLGGTGETVTIDDEKAASYVAKFEKKKSPPKKPKGVEKFVDKGVSKD
jgi:hypothetical protein